MSSVAIFHRSVSFYKRFSDDFPFFLVPWEWILFVYCSNLGISYYTTDSTTGWQGKWRHQNLCESWWKWIFDSLSDDKYPHYSTDLFFDKEFELLQTSKTRNISIIGYKYSKLEREYPIFFFFASLPKKKHGINFYSLTACPVFVHIKLFYWRR